jgi:type IV pilus assembly protein PilB
MRIGELMVMNGLITQDQLDNGLKDQASSKRKIGELLREAGAISERQLAEVLEFQLGYPVVHMYNTTLDPEVVQLIPESTARKFMAVPLQKANDKLKVAMEDPLNYGALEEIRLLTGLTVQPMIAMRSEIEQAIAKHYGLKESMEEIAVGAAAAELVSKAMTEQDAADQDSPIVKIVNQIIQSAVVQKASDIHIEPNETDISIRYRIDGVLHTESILPKQMQSVLTARLKIISKLNITERRLPQDGRIHMQFDRKSVDIRVSTLPAVQGESIVLRILDQSEGIKGIDALGFSESNKQHFSKLLQRPNGIVLISGPTGSGKTSTLYAALQRLNRDDTKIITIEEPVEYRMKGITQVQVNPQVGLSFASGLRSVLRQDPDVVMIGEIRDSETAEIAVRASLTGHLVLSTIHTNSAVDTVIRLVDMGIDSYLIASSLSGVVAQRLVRRICRECAHVAPAREDEIHWLKSLGLEKSTVARGRGCAACHKTGYRGRIALHEVLVVDEAVRRLIAQNRTADELRQHLSKIGALSLMQDGVGKVLNGLTTYEEVMRAVSDD